MRRGVRFRTPPPHIGVSGLEPLASWPPSRHSTKLSYTPPTSVVYRRTSIMSTRDIPTAHISPEIARRIGLAIVEWFSTHKRDLPWRRLRHDPYAVWVSEIMLQQTQVRTVEPYYVRWMDRFPSIEALAHSDIETVLRYWEGLGYYGRARRLHEAARIVVQKHEGALPRDVRLLRALPGIGDYTAAAIAAIAFNAEHIAIDANARRVLQRLCAVAAPDRHLAHWAETMLPEGRCGDFAQGLFELGARVCTAERARCSDCPVESECLGRRSGNPAAFGTSPARPSAVRLRRAAAVVVHSDTVLVVRRGPDGVWSGLWEFPWLEAADGREILDVGQRAALDVAGVKAAMTEALGAIHHSVTRYRVELHAVLGHAAQPLASPLKCAETAWMTWSDIARLPMPAPMRRLAEIARQHRERTAAAEMKESPTGLPNDVASKDSGEPE